MLSLQESSTEKKALFYFMPFILMNSGHLSVPQYLSCPAPPHLSISKRKIPYTRFCAAELPPAQSTIFHFPLLSVKIRKSQGQIVQSATINHRSNLGGRWNMWLDLIFRYVMSLHTCASLGTHVRPLDCILCFAPS